LSYSTVVAALFYSLIKGSEVVLLTLPQLSIE